MIIAYIVCKDESEAEKIANDLLDKKLIFCANMFPINAIFNWKGKRETANETVLIGKSIEEKWQDIIKETKQLHSYEVPAILKMNIEAEENYEKWAREEYK